MKRNEKEDKDNQTDTDILNGLSDPELRAQVRVLVQLISCYLTDKIGQEEFTDRFFRQLQGIKLWLKQR